MIKQLIFFALFNLYSFIAYANESWRPIGIDNRSRNSSNEIIIYQKQEGEKYFYKIGLKEKGKKFVELSRFSLDQFIYNFRLSHDKKSNKTLIYKPENQFETKYKAWPFDAYVFDENKESIEKVQIPAGPWVRKYSVSEKIKSFSCGLRCYTKSNLYLIQNQIYILVHGKAVSKGVAGLYHLKNNQWNFIQRINKSVSSIIPSNDKCELVAKFTDGTRSKIKICDH